MEDRPFLSPHRRAAAQEAAVAQRPTRAVPPCCRDGLSCRLPPPAGARQNRRRPGPDSPRYRLCRQSSRALLIRLALPHQHRRSRRRHARRVRDRSLPMSRQPCSTVPAPPPLPWLRVLLFGANTGTKVTFPTLVICTQHNTRVAGAHRNTAVQPSPPPSGCPQRYGGNGGIEMCLRFSIKDFLHQLASGILLAEAHFRALDLTFAASGRSALCVKRQASSVKRQASSVKRQASSVKRQASSVKRQASKP